MQIRRLSCLYTCGTCFHTTGFSSQGVSMKWFDDSCALFYTYWFVLFFSFSLIHAPPNRVAVMTDVFRHEVRSFVWAQVHVQRRYIPLIQGHLSAAVAMTAFNRSSQIDLCVSQSNCRLHNLYLSTREITHILIFSNDWEAVIVECSGCI